MLVAHARLAPTCKGPTQQGCKALWFTWQVAGGTGGRASMDSTSGDPLAVVDAGSCRSLAQQAPSRRRRRGGGIQLRTLAARRSPSVSSAHWFASRTTASLDSPRSTNAPRSPKTTRNYLLPAAACLLTVSCTLPVTRYASHFPSSSSASVRCLPPRHPRLPPPRRTRPPEL